MKEVLAELKTINERNKKVDEDEEIKKRRFEISDAEFSFLLIGVAIGFLAQVFYDFYSSFFPNNPAGKGLVGLAIAFFLLASIYLYMRNQSKKYEAKKVQKLKTS